MFKETKLIMCTLILKVQNNKAYLECIFYLSGWEERQMKEKCVLKHSFNTVDGEGQTCGWTMNAIIRYFWAKWNRNVYG